MFKIRYTDNGRTTWDKNVYDSECDAYFRASKTTDSRHHAAFGYLAECKRPAIHVTFPTKLSFEGFAESGKGTWFTAEIVEERPDYGKQGEIDFENSDDLLAFFHPEGPKTLKTLLKHSKPDSDFRKDGWTPFTREGAKAYRRLVDAIYGIGSITGATAEAEELVENLDATYELDVPVCDDLENDYYDAIDYADNAGEVRKIVSDARKYDRVPTDEMRYVEAYAKEVLRDYFGEKNPEL